MNLVAANWKMHLTVDEARAYCDACSAAYDDWQAVQAGGVRPILFVPSVHLSICAAELPEGFVLGAQNIHQEEKGAFTGEISAAMVKSAGATAILVGHSERRQYNAEDDAQARAKVKLALAQGLQVILCVGETLAQREAGKAVAVVREQVKGALAGLDPKAMDPDRLGVAYEPVWAIGTGKEASPQDAEEMSQAVLAQMAEMGLPVVPVLYGGSVKPENAAGLAAMPHVGGALVGGAALKPDQFLAIAQAFSKQ